MKKASGWNRLRDISIAKKLYFIVGAMAILITAELLALWFSIHTLSAVRAFIGAEGLWSKAQKDAVFQLDKYHRTHNIADYNAFQKFLEVPLGDHKARIELLKKDPDLNIVRQGFAEGRIHPADMDGMINLVTEFNDNRYISKAIGNWGQGDSLIFVLMPIAEKMHQQIATGNANEQTDKLALEISAINEQLTRVEDNFSFTLEEGARWLEGIVLKILFSVALTVEITGLVLTVLVTRNITKGLNEINRAADKITQGRLDERARILARDEIGHVAASVNKMAEQLIVSNQELENFANVASHDLQEPLRKVIMFTGRLEQETAGMTTEKGKFYMERITESVSRMQQLVGNILQYAALNVAVEFEKVDLEKTIQQVIADMEISITKSNATVTAGKMPSIEANQVQMQQLFQNLIGNSLKFCNDNPEIYITAEIKKADEILPRYRQNLESASFAKNGNGKQFCFIKVKDNGIGFDEAYAEKIFIAFQRLHGKSTYQGTGIGLAICKRIVEKHQGTIFAESFPGEGATFVIILPVEQPGPLS